MLNNFVQHVVSGPSHSECNRWPTDLAAILDAGAWPLLVLIVVLIFFREIKETIPRLENFSFAGFQLSAIVSHDIRNAKKAVDLVSSQDVPAASDSNTNNKRTTNDNAYPDWLLPPGEESPRGARITVDILRAWEELEELLRTIAVNEYPDRRHVIRGGNHRQLINQVNSLQVLDAADSLILGSLLSIRNRAARYSDRLNISREDYNSYMYSMIRFADHLRHKYLKSSSQ